MIHVLIPIGALAGLGSLAGVIAPPAAAWSFGYCIDSDPGWQLPGIAFFGASAHRVRAPGTVALRHCFRAGRF